MMREYFKKVILFTLGKILIYSFCYNFLILNKEYIFYFNFNTWHIIDIIGLFVFSFIDIGIIKLISNTINEKMYKSNKIIFYYSIIFQSRIGIEILLFNPTQKNTNFLIILSYIYLLLIFVIINYLRKYYLELTGVVVLTNLAIFHLVLSRPDDFIDIIARNVFNISGVSNPVKGVIFLVFIIICLTLIILFKKFIITAEKSKKQK